MDLVSNVFLFLRRNLLLGKRLNIFTSSADEDGIEPAAGIDGFRFSFFFFNLKLLFISYVCSQRPLFGVTCLIVNA